MLELQTFPLGLYVLSSWKAARVDVARVVVVMLCCARTSYRAGVLAAASRGDSWASEGFIPRPFSPEKRPAPVNVMNVGTSLMINWRPASRTVLMADAAGKLICGKSASSLLFVFEGHMAELTPGA